MGPGSQYKVNLLPAVVEFLNKLTGKEQAFTARQVELLQEFGPTLSFPHVRHFDGKIWELRIRCDKKIFRLFYIIDGQKQIKIFYGLRKTSERLPVQTRNLIIEKAKSI